jgi:hypothetical protein
LAKRLPGSSKENSTANVRKPVHNEGRGGKVIIF